MSGAQNRGHRLELWSKTEGLQKTISHKIYEVMNHTARWALKTY